MFCKRGVLRNLAKFTGKHLRQILFFDKVAGLRPATLLKKRLWHRCFPVNFAKFSRTTFFKEHLRWLLLTLLRGITSKHDCDFYCLNYLHSFRTENKLKNMMMTFIAWIIFILLEQKINLNLMKKNVKIKISVEL